MLTLFSLALTVLPRTVTALPQPDAARYGFTSVEEPPAHHLCDDRTVLDGHQATPCLHSILGNN